MDAQVLKRLNRCLPRQLNLNRGIASFGVNYGGDIPRLDCIHAWQEQQLKKSIQFTFSIYTFKKGWNFDDFIANLNKNEKENSHL